MTDLPAAPAEKGPVPERQFGAGDEKRTRHGWMLMVSLVTVVWFAFWFAIWPVADDTAKYAPLPTVLHDGTTVEEKAIDVLMYAVQQSGRPLSVVMAVNCNALLPGGETRKAFIAAGEEQGFPRRESVAVLHEILSSCPSGAPA